MKNLFPGYYRPTDDEFEELWLNCKFVFDTNVLLNLYSYSPTVRDEFLNLLSFLAHSDRLWIPYQVALEYQRERLNQIKRQSVGFSEAAKKLDQFGKDLKSEIEAFSKQFRAVDFGSLIENINNVLAETKKKVQQQKRSYPKLVKKDVIREKLDETFEGRVGHRFTENELENIFQKGELRFRSKQPPSFEDEGKGGIRQYGDLVIWFEIIEFAKSTSSPVIFVTDDAKRDWWLHENNVRKPHPELIQEIYNEAGTRFYMYQSDEFLVQAKSRLNLSIAEDKLQEAVEEIRDVRDAATREAEELELLKVRERRARKFFGILDKINSPTYLTELNRQNNITRHLIDLWDDPTYRAPMKRQAEISRQMFERLNDPAYFAEMKRQDEIARRLLNQHRQSKPIINEETDSENQDEQDNSTQDNSDESG